jgi:V8-like Glu-specific endopeptidase
MKFDLARRAPLAVAGGALLFAILAAEPAPAHAQNAVTSNPAAASQSNVKDYWTPERLMSAKPLELHPQVGSDGIPIAPESAEQTAPPASSPGAAPSVPASGHAGETLVPPEMLTKPQSQNDELQLDSGEVTESSTSFGAYFTILRVFPDATTTTYPFLTAGKLFFTDPKTKTNFVCSASVLRLRIVATAGHCVGHASTSASGRYFYSNWLFLPAYNAGVAPLGSWTPNTEYVTNAWYHSNASVPNQQDVGMLVINDVVGAGTGTIGSVTGYLGYSTNQLADNNVTMLAYPCNLDSCGRMEETNAQTFESGGNNTYIYGSAMRDGASGGPWIMNFGINPARTPANTPPVGMGNNYLIAVTSYGPIATTPAYLGASNLGAGFLNMLATACGEAAGNC